MPDYLQWFEILTKKWPDLIITILGVLGGFYFSYLIYRKQNKHEISMKLEAYINNLSDEYEDNLKILSRVQSYIVKGPAIDHLWSPVEVHVNYLSADAWKEILKSGIVSSFHMQDRKLFRTASRSVLDVKRLVQEIASNWIRIKEWNEHDIEQGNQLLNTRELYQSTILNEVDKSIKNAITNLKDALKILEQYKTKYKIE